MAPYNSGTMFIFHPSRLRCSLKRSGCASPSAEAAAKKHGGAVSAGLEDGERTVRARRARTQRAAPLGRVGPRVSRRVFHAGPWPPPRGASCRASRRGALARSVASPAWITIAAPSKAENRAAPARLPSSAPQHTFGRALVRSTAVRPLYSRSNCLVARGIGGNRLRSISCLTHLRQCLFVTLAKPSS